MSGYWCTHCKERLSELNVPDGFDYSLFSCNNKPCSRYGLVTLTFIVDKPPITKENT